MGSYYYNQIVKKQKCKQEVIETNALLEEESDHDLQVDLRLNSLPKALV